MKIVAFLQNQWFKNPERMKQILDRQFKGDREKFIKTYLFWSCLTGKRLTAAFGGLLCDQIVWQEASEEMGGVSSSAFPANPEHMAAVIERHRPTIVLAFGQIAVGGAMRARTLLPSEIASSYQLLTACHPAARGSSVVYQLASMANDLKALMAKEAA